MGTSIYEDIAIISKTLNCEFVQGISNRQLPVINEIAAKSTIQSI